MKPMDGRTSFRESAMQAPPRRTRSLVYLVALAVIVLAAFGRPAARVEAANRSVSVGQQNGGTTAAQNFNPAVRQAIAGDTVTWYHAYGTHDVHGYSGDWGSGPKGGMNPGGAIPTYARVFSTPGTYTYYCDEHSGPSDAEPDRIDERIAEGKMVGKIVVSAATPPVVTAMAASPNPTGGAASVTLTATVSDNVGVTTARYKVDAGFAVAMALSGTTATASVPTTGLAVGPHQLTVEAVDALGSVGSASITLTVQAPPGGGGGGSLSFTSQPVTFGTLPAGPDSQETPGTTPAWRAVDATGSGAGWNLTVIATDMISAGDSIAAANMRVQLVQGAIVTVSGSTAPQTQVPAYQPLSNTTPLKLLRATPGTGAGTYDFTPDFRLTVPAGTPPGTYTSSITVTMNSGP